MQAKNKANNRNATKRNAIHAIVDPKLPPKLTVPFTGFGSTNVLAATVAAAAVAAAAAADAATSCCLRRAPKLLVGLRVAGVPAPMGVASLSDEAAALTRTAGSGKMNSCAHSGGNLRL